MRKLLAFILAFVMVIPLFNMAAGALALNGKDSAAIPLAANAELSAALNVKNPGEPGYYEYETFDGGYPNWPFTVQENVDGRDKVAVAQTSTYYRSTVKMCNPITLAGGSKIRFDTKIETDEGEHFVLQLNGVNTELMLRGVADWKTYEYTVPQTDQYTISWVYDRTNSNYDITVGHKVWLDNIEIETVDSAPLEGIRLEPSELDMYVGDTHKLNLILEPQNAEITSVNYSSSNTNAVTVDSDGTLHAVATGSAKITARVMNFTAESTVIVVEPLKINEMDFSNVIELDHTYDVKLNSTDAQRVILDGMSKYAVGHSLTLDGGAGAELTFDKAAENSLGNVKLCIYDKKFNLIASAEDLYGYMGGAYIKLINTSEEAQTYYVVTSTCTELHSGNGVLTTKTYNPIHINTLTLSLDKLNLSVGDKALAIAYVDPRFNDFSKITWESSDTDVVTVQSNGNGYNGSIADSGMITAVGNGHAVVTATVDGKTASIDVIVGEPKLPEYDGNIYFYNRFDRTYLKNVGFMKYDTTDPDSDIVSVMPKFGFSDIVSGVYFNGKVYCYGYYEITYFGSSMDYYVFDANTMTLQSSTPLYDESGFNARKELPLDLTYDYTTNTTFGVIEDQDSKVRSLGKIDLATGDVELIAAFETAENESIRSITADAQGVLYAMTNNGVLYTVDPESAALTRINDLKIQGGDWQTMLYDFYTEELYWLFNADGKTHLVAADIEGNVSSNTDIGSVDPTSAFIYANPETFPNPIIKVESVAIDPAELTLDIFGTGKLTAVITPADATDQGITWASDNEEVVTVDAEGNIEGLKEGSAKITVTTSDGGHTAEALITVVDNAIHVESVSIEPEELTIAVGEVSKLTAVIAPENADNKNVTWTSSNESAVSVDEDGNVTALRIGVAYIDVITQDGNHKASAKITVTEAAVRVESVTVSPEELTLAVGEAGKLTVTVLPANAADKAVAWSSDNESVATVDENGNVTAVSVGSANITVVTADGGHTASVVVTVVDAAEVNTYKVTFVDYAGNEIAVIEVKEGEDAIAPEPPVHPDGLPFGMWSADFTNVHEDITVKAISIGDVNQNGAVEAGDATLVLRAVVSSDEPSEAMKILADANQNGSIEAGDATILLRYTVGIGWPKIEKDSINGKNIM